MKSQALQLRKRETDWTRVAQGTGLALLGIAGVLLVSSQMTIGNAENFTDIFYTNSFRGAFEWFKKLDWVGMLVQGCISVFSLLGVSLLVMQLMSSMLFLSARGLWEEVHDLKSSGGGESELYDFGVVNMAKSWAKGKAGTGLDAIIGAVLILLPDIMRYSYFSEKSGAKFDADITISQFMLKMALPIVMSVFFFSMGFNGTLFKALAVTVDAMGAVADKAVSVNYAGFVDDLVNQGTGYKFTFASQGTTKGDFQQELAKDIYGRVISDTRGADANQLYQMGVAVEKAVNDLKPTKGTWQVTEKVLKGLQQEKTADKYYGYLGYEPVVNTSKDAAGAAANLSIADLTKGTGMVTDGTERYIHIFIKQVTDFNGGYFNVGNTGR